LSSEAAGALRDAGVADVSRETLDRLERFVELLKAWNPVHNLVGPAALPAIWTRHVADSAELLRLAPTACRWLDLGSGAGFPGLVVAALLAERADAGVDLVEASATKAAFLREAARRLDVPATVHCGRIERILPAWDRPVDAVSARALAPMPKLVAWTTPLLKRGVPAYLHKGLDFDAEWRQVAHPERFDLVKHESRIGPGLIVELRARPTT